MTYLQILNLIKDTALAQPNVNSVVREFLDLNREDAKYSAVVIQDRDGSRDRIVEQDYVTYTWHLGYVDRLTYDESNRDDIISTGINIINNIVNTIRNTWFPELEVSIVDRINTFDQRFTAQCAGVYVVLAVNAQVSDCVDSESTDLYDTYDAKITANGVYHFVPSGRPVDEINITVDVAGSGKEEVSLTDTVTMNGTHSYIPEEDTVYKDVELTVDVHPTERLVETYTTNGVKTITGEFNGGSVNVDVHPSDKLVETITSNGITNLSGEWKDAEITVAVPSDQKTETICEKVIQENGSFHYYPESGEVFNDVHITTDVHPSDKLVETIPNNGSYSYPGEYAGAEITVNCPVPKTEERGSLTISSNGSGTLIPSSGNVFDGVDYVVDVHPSDKLIKTITSNGTKSFSGEWKDAEITVDVPSKPEYDLMRVIKYTGSFYFEPDEGSVFRSARIVVDIMDKPESALVETITSNGSYSYEPEEGSVFNRADITVDVHPSDKLVKTYTENGTYNVSGEWKDAAITVEVPTNVNANTLRISQTEYDNLSVKDPDTIYLIYY